MSLAVIVTLWTTYSLCLDQYSMTKRAGSSQYYDDCWTRHASCRMGLQCFLSMPTMCCYHSYVDNVHDVKKVHGRVGSVCMLKYMGRPGYEAMLNVGYWTDLDQPTTWLSFNFTNGHWQVTSVSFSLGCHYIDESHWCPSTTVTIVTISVTVMYWLESDSIPDHQSYFRMSFKCLM